VVARKSSPRPDTTYLSGLCRQALIFDDPSRRTGEGPGPAAQGSGLPSGQKEASAFLPRLGSAEVLFGRADSRCSELDGRKGVSNSARGSLIILIRGALKRNCLEALY
jgi:hypothetical protein